MSCYGTAAAELARCPGVPSISRDSTPTIYRRNKGMGGTSRPDTDLPSNLLAVDPVVHNGGPRSVHGRRVFSQAQGWLISKENIFKPVSVPVFVATGPGLGRWALLDDKGGRAYLGPVLRLPDE